MQFFVFQREWIIISLFKFHEFVSTCIYLRDVEFDLY